MQNWFFIFSESSVFKKRFIKFTGSRNDCIRNFKFWHLEQFVSAVLSEKDFVKKDYVSWGYKELDIEEDLVKFS